MPDPKGKKEENEVERLKWATRREASKPAMQGHEEPSTTTRESD